VVSIDSGGLPVAGLAGGFPESAIGQVQVNPHNGSTIHTPHPTDDIISARRHRCRGQRHRHISPVVYAGAMAHARHGGFPLRFNFAWPCPALRGHVPPATGRLAVGLGRRVLVTLDA